MRPEHHTAYIVLVVLHVVAALVAFGAVALSGVYASTARHLDRPDSAEEAARFFRTRALADWVLLAVPLLGLSAVGVGGIGFGRLWVVVALVLWSVAAGAVFGVARPARRRVRAALAVLVPPAAALEAAAPDTAAPPAAAPETAALEAAAPEAAGAPGTAAADVTAAATRLAWAAAVVDVVFVVALLDMVYKPG